MSFNIKEKIFDFCSIDCNVINVEFQNCLRHSGYAVLEIDNEQNNNVFSIEELLLLEIWEMKLRNIFLNLNEKEKLLMGKYRSEKGVAVGYRKDDNREFIESHLKEGLKKTNNLLQNIFEIVPYLHKIPSDDDLENDYCNLTTKIICLLRKIGYRVLLQIAR